MAATTHDITAPVANDFQMIGIMEFACRMGVCANTVRNWIEDGRLKPGVHFLRVNRILRFPGDRASMEKIIRDMTPVQAPPRPRLNSRRRNRVRIKLKC